MFGIHTHPNHEVLYGNNNDVVPPSRIKEAYANQAMCEYPGCQFMATQRCTYNVCCWRGCGKVICHDHARN